MEGVTLPTPPDAGPAAAHDGPKEPEAPSLRVAWILFLVVGLPPVLMGILSILARAGIYLDPFRVLWQPWPPDIVKPFLGVGVFAATLGYLTYKIGRRVGFHKGTVAGIVFIRNQIGNEIRQPVAQPPPPPEASSEAVPEGPSQSAESALPNEA